LFFFDPYLFFLILICFFWSLFVFFDHSPTSWIGRVHWALTLLPLSRSRAKMLKGSRRRFLAVASVHFGTLESPEKLPMVKWLANLSTMLCSLGSAVGALGCGGLCLSDSSTATLTYKGLHWDPIVCAYINIYIHRLKVTYTIIIWKVHLPMYGVFGLSTIGIHELWSLPARNRQFRLEKGMVMVHRKGMAQSDHFNLQRSIL
jgi:hypothetical protein